MAVDLNTIGWQEFPLFQNVGEDVARRFMALGFHFQYEAGTPLVVNNDKGETFFLIVSGLAKLTLVNARGEEVNVTLFRSGEFFGELSMLEDQPMRSANIISLTAIDVIAIQKKDFLKIVHQHPELLLNIARVLGQRLLAMNQRMVTERLTTDMDKVGHTLMLLARKGMTLDDRGTVLLPPLSLQDWALFCHTDREAFMACIERFKELGILEWQNQRIVVLDLEALQRLAKLPREGEPT